MEEKITIIIWRCFAIFIHNHFVFKKYTENIYTEYKEEFQKI